MKPDDALRAIARQPDVLLAVAVVAIVGAMIVPLPPWLLDTLIAANLAAGCALLIAALCAREALKVASFPALLLITTLFRLALNVSATRLALTQAHAGEVIQAVGEFVVGGNYVVGAVVFAILTLVQFLVVAKGAERVAEVAARFTLDAMPGKQMAIDAELRAGSIDPPEARRRRRGLERESQMYGAMDGAMKFVKGDAIAGIAIVLVNCLGGLCIGVLMHELEVGAAARTYALLAIGDGLVSQIPSLCVAISAGFVVTRVAGEDEDSTLGGDIGAQLFGQPRALAIVAGLLVALGLVPGMPLLPFAALAAAAGAGAWRLRRASAVPQEAGSPGAPGAAAGANANPAANAVDALPQGVAPVCLDLGPGLDALVAEDGGRLAREDLPAVREAVYAELGVRVPGIRVRTGATHLGKGYAVLIDEVPCARGEVEPGAAYARVPAAEIAFLGLSGPEVVDPIGGGTMTRLCPADAGLARAAGIDVRTAREVAVAHLRAALRKRAASFVGVQETQALLDALDPVYPALVREATQKVPVPLVAEVLRRLVEEGVSVRNLRTILESFAEPGASGDGLQLAERARRALRRQISHRHGADGTLYAYLCDPAIEEAIRQGLAASDSGVPALDPDQAAAILEGVKASLDGAPGGVILAAPDVRRYLRKLCEGAFPDVAVLAYGELEETLSIRPLGKVAILPG